MIKKELISRYLSWMNQLVCYDGYCKRTTHKSLLTYLYTTEFVYPEEPMDANRADDGTNLRYRFGYEYDLSPSTIDLYFGDVPCSILEMILGLAIRCEEHIMDDPDIGNRTGKWFWGMIKNLGLLSMSDDKFNMRYVESVITTFLDRKYDSNGRGGLFTVHNPPRDLRTVEIWYQLCWYLDKYIKRE